MLAIIDCHDDALDDDYRCNNNTCNNIVSRRVERTTHPLARTCDKDEQKKLKREKRETKFQTLLFKINEIKYISVKNNP